jgi:hypothetical protein
MTAEFPGLTGEQIRALKMLAGRPDGCPESEMKARVLRTAWLRCLA